MMIVYIQLAFSEYCYSFAFFYYLRKESCAFEELVFFFFLSRVVLVTIIRQNEKFYMQNGLFSDPEEFIL